MSKSDLKRKWQIALRRYIIEGRPAVEYAPYFGIHNIGFRRWIELSFKNGMTWSSFGKIWQLDHIVPVSLFNLDNEKDLFLCWNFINIKPSFRESSDTSHFDSNGVIEYFEVLYEKSGYNLAKEMVIKIKSVYKNQEYDIDHLVGFLVENKDFLNRVGRLSSLEMELINSGKGIDEAIKEAEDIRRLSSF
jgi:hypothetical protein